MMKIKEQSDILRKLKVLNYGKETGNVSKACRYFGIYRETYYKWKIGYEQYGETSLINNKLCPENSKIRVAAEIEEKILYWRKTCHFGQQRISRHLKRYHDIKVSPGGVYVVLKRHDLNKLPRNQRKRSMEQFKRYEKQVSGHRIRVDVKFLFFTGKDGKEVKRFQYTAIDDATRACALRIYDSHSRKQAIDFIDYVLRKFPFRVHSIQTDNGHEFQSFFYWRCEDLIIRHVYIKKPALILKGRLNDLTDQQEFYQLIEYTDDIDIEKKLKEWEMFYNSHRPNAALNGKTPYEILRNKLLQKHNFSLIFPHKKAKVREKIYI